MRRWRMRGAALTLLALGTTLGCGPATTRDDAKGAGAGSGGVVVSEEGSDDGEKLDLGPGHGRDPDERPSLDVLVVIDDGPSMLAEQTHLGRNLLGFANGLGMVLDGCGSPFPLDTHVMVTHTSIGGACERDSGGAPVSTPCSDRLEDFVGADGQDAAAACMAACPEPVSIDGEWIAFFEESNNIDAPPPADLDGDGTPESDVARALGCLGMQGVSGCAFGSPLEAMRRALDPSASWNTGPEPFLRDDAALAIAIVTDGLDCAGASAALADPTLWEVDPATGRPAPSEAACWNGGVQCDGPDAAGVYTGCQPADGPLTDVDAYVQFLADLRDGEDKRIVMLGTVGVPLVTEHSPQSPFEPIAGGFGALEVHDWSELDLAPGDAAAGLGVADKEFELGIGPGCTALTRSGDTVGQGVPPIRIAEVCKSLDEEPDDGWPRVHCCLESICDETSNLGHGCIYTLSAPWMTCE
ncbi:MAG: hypothetical protein AAF721_31955 [Myxococcota bacterium]